VNPIIAKVPSQIGYYLAGFTDGEGSFNISFRPRPDYQIPWKISVSFNVSQKDRVILALFKRYLGCGTLRGRPDGVWYFEVTDLNAVIENVIPFFERFGFLSAKKKRDFFKFKQIVALMRDDAHLNFEGIRRIISIREMMNDGGKRRYSHAEILASLTESPETIRQAPLIADDDIVRSSSRDEGLEDLNIPAAPASSIDDPVNTNKRS
jgi:hypothetical protein